MDIKTKFGVAKDIKIEPYSEHETYILGYINVGETEYDLLGFDAPVEDDPVWRFWVESGDADEANETNDAEISEEDKELIKKMYAKYKRKCSNCKRRAFSSWSGIDFCLGYEMENEEYNEAENCERYEEGNPSCYYDDEYTPSATHGDYSPSSPWNAPGMSISDFI